MNEQRVIAEACSTLSMTANATSQNVALPTCGGLMLDVINTGGNLAHVALTSDANAAVMGPTAAVSGGYPIPANNVPVRLTIKPGQTRFMAIAPAGATTLYFSKVKDI